MRLDWTASPSAAPRGVALVYALRHPAKVEKLLLSGAYGLQERVLLHEAAALLARVPGLTALFRHLLRRPPLLRLALHTAVHRPGAVTDELVADCLAPLHAPHALDAFARWLRTELLPHHTRTHLTSELDALEMPVLLLHGAHDLMVPVFYARRAVTHLPRACLHVLPHAGHLAPREFPAEVNARIVQFLTG